MYFLQQYQVVEQNNTMTPFCSKSLPKYYYWYLWCEQELKINLAIHLTINCVSEIELFVSSSPSTKYTQYKNNINNTNSQNVSTCHIYQSSQNLYYSDLCLQNIVTFTVKLHLYKCCKYEYSSHTNMPKMAYSRDVFTRD